MIKRASIIFTTILVMVTVGAVHAQPGSISLSSSSYRSWCCNSYDQQPGLIKIYVYHVFTPGATASQFMVVSSSGAYLTYLGESSPFDAVIGNSQTGIAISYGACLSSPISLLEIMYFGMGLSETCSFISVRPSPSTPSGNIEVADCSDPPNVLFSVGGDLVINPDESCMWWECFCDPDPVEQTSWGQIKSLYRGE
ncbi:MAG: hypothetical protein KAJ19_30165 [Gammaproteobacteria bacterium]|nr:hypothetical protein [Gammaproteobacteria bacterium]